MAVETTTPKKEVLNIPKLNAWLAEVGASSTCPFCQSVNWEVAVPEDAFSASLPWCNPRGELFMSGLPVIPLICTKCRFVRPVAVHESVRKSVFDEVDE